MPVKLKSKSSRPMLYCYIEPFVINQNVFEREKENEDLKLKDKVPLNDIVEYMAQMSSKYYILVDSNSYKMSTGYVEDITDFAIVNYGFKDIQIEAVKR